VSQELKPATETAVGRRVALVAIGAAGAAVVAGCATYGGSSDTPAAPAEPPAAGGAGTVLGAAADVPVGGGKVFPDQQVVVTQPSKGTFACFTAVCTHAGCAVDEVKGGTINCPCHGSKFKIADGSVSAGPATSALAKKTITVTGDKISLA
jgi:Rieske Fe-S protein